MFQATLQGQRGNNDSNSLNRDQTSCAPNSQNGAPLKTTTILNDINGAVNNASAVEDKVTKVGGSGGGTPSSSSTLDRNKLQPLDLSGTTVHNTNMHHC